MMVKMKYTLYVDDNFHRHDGSNDWHEDDQFHSLDEAIAKAKHIVDEFLSQEYRKGMNAEELYSQYTTFGEDPFILGGPPESDFKGWPYAKTRCDEICSAEGER